MYQGPLSVTRITGCSSPVSGSTQSSSSGRPSSVSASVITAGQGGEGSGGAGRHGRGEPQSWSVYSTTGAIHHTDPEAISMRVKSVCQTRFRPVGVAANAFQRAINAPRGAGRLQQALAVQGPVDAALRGVHAVGAHHRPDLAVAPC